jgi:hypothetical protein
MGQTDYPETSVTTNQRRETSQKIEELIYTVQEPEITRTLKHTAWEKFFYFILLLLQDVAAMYVTSVSGNVTKTGYLVYIKKYSKSKIRPITTAHVGSGRE